jgi:GT2 family glycosyltransferase
MANKDYKVCIVTVTYGNRSNFLKQQLDKMLPDEAIKYIIINDNASNPPIETCLPQHQKIKLITQKQNMGSALGYQQALTYAINNTDADFFWLLDDDNVPEVETLTNLLNYWEKLPNGNDLKALSCLRPDRSAHQEILRGANPSDYYLVPNNFMGFHLGRIFKNRLRKLNKKSGEPKQYAKMPYVPYGGFFLHRKGIEKIGFPDERLFLYVDDSEYTYRITKAGGSIYLIANALVLDVDVSQGINYNSGFLKSKILDLWNFRTYYQVRNRIYFYNRETIKDKYVFWFNKQLYLWALLVKAVLNGQLKQYHNFKKAVEDGTKENLNTGDPKYF